MAEKLPINGDVFRWARSSAGLTLDELALKMKRPVSELRRWETGEDSPTYAQLEKAATLYLKRPIAIFFFPTVPDEDTVQTDFRTLPGTVLDTLPPEIIRLYRKAKAFQLNIHELLDDRRPTEQSLITGLHPLRTSAPSKLAVKCRELLSVSLSVQYEWGSSEVATREWRQRLEENGIFVFKDAFKNDRFSGFCLYDDLYPLIYVNNSLSFTRQTFTLFHELYHLIIARGGVDFNEREMITELPAQYARIEQESNLFANQVLVPEESLDRQDLRPAESNIERLAGLYGVSREVILRNLLDRKIVNADRYDELVGKWSDEGSRRGGSGHGNYYFSSAAYLGRRYIDLVFGKYYSGRISADQASEYLGVKVKNLGSLETHVSAL